VSGPTGGEASLQAQKGVSLWADAWRRLRKNHMAMAGLGVVVIMGALCAFADLIAPFDPQYGFTWINAIPPGGEHVDVLNKSKLEVGKPPEVRDAYADAGTIALVREESEWVQYRVQVDRRRRQVKKIQLEVGARAIEAIDVSDQGGYLVEVYNDDSVSKPLDVTVIEDGERMPEVFGRKAVVFLRHVTPAAPVTYTAKTEVGAITRYTDEGEEYEVQGRIVAELTRDGEPIEEVEIDGRDVLEVTADGEPQRVSHLLGTDLSGRDVFSRVLYGGRISLLVGLVATIVSLVIGVVYGAISGYAGGRLDALMMAAVDVLFGLPYIFLVILLMVNFGRDIIMLFLALGLVQWLMMARIVRGQVLSLKQKEFIEAARMSGSGPGKILFGHLIPNTIGIVIVYTTLTVPAVILQESFLAFIGLAVTYQGQNLDSWGALVNYGVGALGDDGERAWLLITPSVAMAATLFSLNFLGDGLRDAFDPQQRGRT